ncbi:hypothetical protein Tco_0040826 [Tanacetum coccineum]
MPKVKFDIIMFGDMVYFENCWYRGDSNMAALGVDAVIEEDAHDSLIFRDVVSCEVIFKWMVVMKEDMDTRKAMIWVSKGLLDEAKENILGMKIYKNRSGNYDEEKRGLSWVTDGRVHVFVDSDYAKGTSITVMCRSITRYGFMIQECAMSSEAILQHVVALLTTGAEYMTLTG